MQYSATQLFKSQNIKVTLPRKLVYRTLEQSNVPLTAYQVQEKTNQKAELNISTIYRVLETLERANLAHKLQHINAYVLCHTEDVQHCHNFLICEDCNTVTEFIDHNICDIETNITKTYDFKPRNHAIEIVGKCRNCR